MFQKFRTVLQRTSRMLVEKSIYNEPIEKVRKFANKTSLKNPVTRELNMFEDIFEKLFIFIKFRKIHFPKFL